MEIKDIFGDSPGEYRVGVVALANDQVIERDLTRLLPPGILTFTTRIAFGGDCKLEQLAKMGPVLTGAAELLNPEVELDAVVFGCTSGTIAIGPDDVRAAIQATCPKATVVNPVDAACDAFDHLGVKRLNLVTPYESGVADLMARTFAGRGFEIVNRFDFGITESADISRVTPDAIRKAATALDTQGVDAIFVSCTDFQSLEVLADIEVATGLPTVSSNQAMAWKILTNSSVSAIENCYGALLKHVEQKNSDQQGEST